MEKLSDRITDAYLGELEHTNSVNNIDRINWICAKSTGEKILDIGCSQGIISILLGREGKQVLGIDINEESIQFATNFLRNENSLTQRCLEFKVVNFFEFNENDEKEKFDSIILGNLLQTLTDQKRVIKRASKMLKENGCLIITVPIGTCLSIQQGKVFYLSELLNLQFDELFISEIDFFDEWIGVVYQLSPSGKKLEINMQLLQKLESSFEKIEKGYISRKSEVTGLHPDSNKANNNRVIDESNINHERELTIASINKNIYLEEQLAASFRNEEELLLSYKKLLTKFNALSNSKLGKLTMYYWKKRRSIFGGK